MSDSDPHFVQDLAFTKYSIRYSRPEGDRGGREIIYCSLMNITDKRVTQRIKPHSEARPHEFIIRIIVSITYLLMKELNHTNIEEKIRNCQAVQSMLDEMQISSKMKALDWSVTDNPYYEDAETGKFRELDVFGRLGTRLESKKLHCSIELLVESKSASDYHILFSNADRFISSDLDTDWLGNHFEKKGKIPDILKRCEFDKKDIDLLFEKVGKFSYPNRSWIFSDWQYSFFNKLESFYSFRETNLGLVKELNNSVVWKSFRELLTVNTSIRQRHLDNMLEDMEFYIDQKTANSKVDSAFMCLENYLSRITYIHPVLVIDSPLWKLDQAGNLSSISYARLIQTDLYGSNQFWMDIVHRQHFNEYIDAMTEHTKKSLTHLHQVSAK